MTSGELIAVIAFPRPTRLTLLINTILNKPAAKPEQMWYQLKYLNRSGYCL